MRAGEQVGEAVLGVVGVLVLVDEHEAERLLVVLEPVGIALEQLDGLHEQVVEVHRVHLGVALLVELVGVGRHLREAAALLAELGGPQQLVLGVADLAADRLRRVPLGVDVQLHHAALDEPAAVVLVVDGERALVAHALGLAAQQARAHAVERADPHGARHRPHEALDALLHLAGRLVGERDGHHLVRADVLHLEEPGDAVREYARLAGARAGEDQERPVDVGDRLALLGVEAGEQRVVLLRGTTRALAGPAAGRHPMPPPSSRLMARAMKPANTRRRPDSQRRSREMAPRKAPRKNSSSRPTATARR